MGYHKQVERQCPVCLKLKAFEIRHKTCSRECADELNRRTRRNDILDRGQTEALDDGIEYKENSIRVSLPKTRIHTLDELIAFFEVDSSTWEVERFVCNKWEVGAKDNDGQIQVEPLYQVKAWFKRKVLVCAVRDELKQLLADAKAKMPKLPAITRKKGEQSGNMVEISPVDHHLSRLAWKPQTGANYDTKIARAIWWDAMQYIRRRTALDSPEKILLILGNDLFHVDNPANTTYGGTPQDVDSRYHKTFAETRQLAVDTIAFLREVAPVRVLMVPGNHDTMAAFHLGDSLECRFHDCDDVSIDNGPSLRKYEEWGSVMLMFTHGDKGQTKDYPLLMAAEQPQMFGRTFFREAHLGHIHHERTIEKNGIRVRSLPSLVAPDAWHAAYGYIGSIRSTEFFTWNKATGLLAANYFNLGDSDKYDHDSVKPSQSHRPHRL